jgi:hypothetical protein
MSVEHFFRIATGRGHPASRLRTNRLSLRCGRCQPTTPARRSTTDDASSIEAGISHNACDQRLATLDLPSGPILSRVRCIASFGLSGAWVITARTEDGNEIWNCGEHQSDRTCNERLHEPHSDIAYAQLAQSIIDPADLHQVHGKPVEHPHKTYTKWQQHSDAQQWRSSCIRLRLGEPPHKPGRKHDR